MTVLEDNKQLVQLWPSGCVLSGKTGTLIHSKWVFIHLLFHCYQVGVSGDLTIIKIGVRTTIDSSSSFIGAIERVEWSPILWNYTQNEDIEFIWQRNGWKHEHFFKRRLSKCFWLVCVFLMQLSPLCQTSFTVHLSWDSHHPPPAWWLWEQLCHW